MAKRGIKGCLLLLVLFSNYLWSGINSLYLKNVSQKAWWDKEYEYRVSVLITEEAGIKRDKSPVSIIYEFPEGTTTSSIRVVTPYGREIPSQIKVIDKNKKEVIFLLDIDEKENVPLFIYYSKKEMKSPNYSSSLFPIEEAPYYYSLENKNIQVKINKIPSREGSRIKGIYTTGERTNQICCLFDRIYDLGHTGTIKRQGEAKIVEDGPIRKSILFDDGNSKVLYSIYANSNIIYYTYTGNSNFERMTGWLPGGNTINDYFYYESDKGVKKYKIGYTDSGDLKEINFTPYIKEGWIALYDIERGVVVGEIFEINDCKKVSLYQHMTGYRTTIRNNSKQTNGGIFCSKGDFNKLRQAYYEWKSPILVSIGSEEEYHNKNNTIPVFGKDFILMHLMSLGWQKWENERTAKTYIDLIREYGGNYVMFWTSDPFYHSEIFPPSPWMIEQDRNLLNDTIEEAHKQNMGVIAGMIAEQSPWYHIGLSRAGDNRFNKYKYWQTPDGKGEVNWGNCYAGIDPVLGRHIYIGKAEELAKHNIEGIWLLDEFGYNPKYLPDKAKEEYKKTYNMEPPEKFDYSKMKDPAQYNMFLYRTNVITELVKDMSNVARKEKPDIFLTHTTSPNNLSFRYGYHDLEAQSDFLTSTNTDLYSNDISYVSYYTKHIRGAMGNTKPVITFSGYCGWLDPKEIELNQYLHLFSGSNSLVYFCLTSHYTNGEGAIGVKRAYNFIDYTGLGNYLVKMNPMKFVGIYRDRNNFFEEIKRGNCEESQLPVTDNRIKCLTTSLKGIPTDIIFSKYFTSLLISPYKVIIVPNDQDLTEKDAEIIKGFVKEGGIVITEGDTIKNKTIEQLCKIKRQGERKFSSYNLVGNDYLTDISFTLPTEGTPIKNEGADVLFSLSDGTPAIVCSSFGKGKVIYSSLVLSTKSSIESNIPVVIKRIIKKNIGYLPIDTDTSIWSNILTDGKNYIISIYNEFSDNKEIEISLNGFSGEYDTLLDFSTGEVIPIGQKTKLVLGPKEVRFYLFANKADILFPVVRLQKEVPIYQSLTPTFVQYKKVEEKKGGGEVKKKEEKEKDVIYVGVFKSAEKTTLWHYGDKAIYEKVSTLPKVKAEYIDDLELSTISYYDVIVVPSGTTKESNLPSGWEKNIREYVEKGGGVLLVHHAVGYSMHSDASLLFPEIGKGVDFTPIQTMQVVEEHPIITGSSFQKKFPDMVQNPAFANIYTRTAMKKGDIFKSGFPDYIVLQKGEKGKVVVCSVAEGEKGGTPSIIVGQVGAGKLVLSGMYIGYECKEVNNKWEGEEKLTEGEEKILINSIYWLGEKEG